MASSVTLQFSELPTFIQQTYPKVYKDSEVVMKQLGAFVDREVQLTFARIASTGTSDQPAYNKTTWKGYSQSTLHPINSHGEFNLSRWRSRYGTDHSKGKYAESSKLMQKSGSYRRSWGILKYNAQGMTYGSTYGEDSKLLFGLLKDRPVLNVDSDMIDSFSTIWGAFVRKAIGGGP